MVFLGGLDLLLKFLPEGGDFLCLFGGLDTHAADCILQILSQLRNLLFGTFYFRLLPAFPLLQSLLNTQNLFLSLHLLPPSLLHAVPGCLLQLIANRKQFIIHHKQ